MQQHEDQVDLAAQEKGEQMNHQKIISACENASHFLQTTMEFDIDELPNAGFYYAM
jgi:hypothetical protein